VRWKASSGNGYALGVEPILSFLEYSVIYSLEASRQKALQQVVDQR